LGGGGGKVYGGEEALSESQMLKTAWPIQRGKIVDWGGELWNYFGVTRFTTN